MDLGDLLGAGDPKQMATQMQQAFGQDGLNPFSLLTGQRRFHGVFLGPFTPGFSQARDEFLSKGTGPLVSIVEQFGQQGLDPAAAALRAREMLSGASAMLAVVYRDDQGVSVMPTLFFGTLNDDYRKYVAEVVGGQDDDELQAALVGLEAVAARGSNWPALINDVDGVDEPWAFWSTLAEHALTGLDEGIAPAQVGRLADLGWWASHALASLRAAGHDSDGDALLSEARCALLASEPAAATTAAGIMLSEYEPEDEQLAVFLQECTDVAVAVGQPEIAVAFMDQHSSDIDAVLGGCYEQALPRFKAVAATQPDPADLIVAAEALQAADRKSFRHALGREPLWRVTVAEPGALLDTREAADLLDRSINFVAKRLEQGTLPTVTDGEQVRIPKRGLEAWKAVMEHFSLLD